MIVEDEHLERKSLQAMLQKYFGDHIGSLRFATNGEKALQEFLSDVPDLVFLDIHIPKINGLELLRRLNRQLETEIIIVSAYSQFEYAQQALRLGVRDYLLKPVDTTQFITVVQEAFDSLARKHQAAKVLQSLTGNHYLELEADFKDEFTAYLGNEKFVRFSELTFSENPSEAVRYLVEQQQGFSFEHLLHFLVAFFQSLDLPQNEFLSSFNLSSIDECLEKREISPALLEHIICDFIKNIHALIEQDGNPEETQHLVKKIDEHLQEHYQDQITLEHLGALINRNPAYISRLYKQQTGLNIKDRLRSIRIAAARQLLERGTMSVKEVAFTVGFSDPNYFSTVFKKETGLSATDYLLFYDKKFEEK